jgi:hypothetical protein
MSQLTERSDRRLDRPLPDEAPLTEAATHRRRGATGLRILGGLAVLVIGAVHLEQYVAVHFDVVPVIGPLFLLNFIGATLIGVGLLIPSGRLHLLHRLLAVAGIGLAATSFVFLFISEHRTLFGFQDYGYRTAIVVVLAAETAAVALLGGYLVAERRPH